MDSPSPPPAPDYTGAAEATAAGNLQNLQYQTDANRINQYTPWGSLTYTNTGDSTTPNWNQYLNLTPQAQSALDSQLQVQQNQSSLANNLQGQVASTMSSPFQAPQYSQYMSGVPGVATGFSGFTPTGVGATQQQFASGAAPLNQTFSTNANALTDPSQFTNGAGNVNLGAPQYNPANQQAYTDAAYQASTGLLQPQWQQDNTNLDAQLRLQGLTPGTEAYNNAYQNQLRAQGQVQSQMAAQAMQLGNQQAQGDYAAQLAGYNAGNAAQQQAYNEGLSSFGAANTALGQQFNQDLAGYNASNAARGQQFQQALAGYGANNAGQQQAYNQALASYGANQSALQNYNQAQQQAYGQGQGNYQTAYQSALQNYMLPLNFMNAVLTGQQVSTPQFNSYASAGYTPGADLSGATAQQGSWNQGLYNAQSASNASNTSALMGLGGAAIMSMF